MKPTGKLKQAYQTIVIMEAKIKELEKHMCIYARENISGFDFNSDKDVFGYFKENAEKHS